MAAGEVAVRVEVDREPFAGMQQLDQQRRVGAVGVGVALAQEALQVRLIASPRLRPSSSRVRPSPADPKAVVVEPTQSSGRNAPPASGVLPRSSSMAAPPR